MRWIVVFSLLNLTWGCGNASSSDTKCGDQKPENASPLRLSADSSEESNSNKDCTPSTASTEQMTSNSDSDPASEEKDKDEGKGDVELTLLKDINRYRAMLGLPDATINPNLAQDAQAHAKYLMTNPDIIDTGVGAHDEDPSRPGYSEGGAESGRASNIHYIDPASAIDGWMATLYHRIPLIRASKLGIGAGHERGAEGSDVEHVVVLDVIRGLGDKVGDQLVFFPPDGATKVPLQFGPEVPDPVVKRPAGYPLTVTWYGQEKITKVSAKLSTGGTDVPFVLSTPASPATYFDQQNTILIYSESPLKPLTTYKVEVSYRLGSENKSLSWSFTTGTEDCCAWK